MERIRQAVEQARLERKNVSEEQLGGAVRSGAAVRSKTAKKEKSAVSFEYTQTPTLEISEATCRKNRLVAAVVGHPLQDTYRMLRTRVLQEMRANDWKTIAITSPTAGSGKSLSAINLAITIARDLSHTALLVDADLRSPSVHEYFDYAPELGLSDYLLHDEPLEKLLFHPNLDRLTVLPGRGRLSESAELLSSPKVVSLINELRGRYSDRIVVLDIAPVLSVDDALALAPNVDCMLMVAEAGETTREELASAIELLEGVPIVGTVLNKISKKIAAPY